MVWLLYQVQNCRPGKNKGVLSYLNSISNITFLGFLKTSTPQAVEVFDMA